MRQALLLLLLAASISGGAAFATEDDESPRDPRQAGTPAASTDEAALYRKSFYEADPYIPAVDPKAKSSVNLSEEFAFGDGPRTNIDSFLGDFENPYASDEATYQGSRSEQRNDPDKRNRP